MENAVVHATPTHPAPMPEPSAQLIEVAQRIPPRDLPAITNKIRDIAVSDPALAKSCIWVRTVGKDKGIEQFRLGPSVRLTELAHQQLGKIWLGPPQYEEKGRALTCTVLAFDLQAINMAHGLASKTIYNKQGRYSDTMVETTRLALHAIAKREAILGLYRAQVESIMNDIKDAIIRNICPEGQEDAGLLEAWRELVGRYREEFGVSEEQMKKVVEKEPNNRDKVVMLLAIYNMLKEGVVEQANVFAPASSRPKTEKPRAKDEPKAQEPKAQVPKAETPAQNEEQNRDAFLNQLYDLAAAAGVENRIEAICMSKFNAKSSKLPPSKWWDALKHFESLSATEGSK